MGSRDGRVPSGRVILEWASNRGASASRRAGSMGAAAQEAVDDDLPVPAQSFGGPHANSATARAAQAEASGILAVVEASPEQRDAFKTRLAGVSVRWDSDAEAFGKLARESVEAVLTAEQLAVVRRFGDEGDVARPSVLLLRAVPGAKTKLSDLSILKLSCSKNF